MLNHRYVHMCCFEEVGSGSGDNEEGQGKQL